MINRLSLFLSLVALLIVGTISAQDSISAKKRKHSPKAATVMSACLPGLGQVYNKKYWKVPLIYAGLGTSYYFLNYTNRQYKMFKTAYQYRTDQWVGTVDTLPQFQTIQLKENMNFYRRYRDLNIAVIALFYIVNIVDANVDAHLYNFDVSDDLSLALMPGMGINGSSAQAMLTLQLRFK